MNTRYRFQFILTAFTLCTWLMSCKDEVDLPYQPLASYTQLYMPQAVNGPINKVLSITEEEQHAIYGAYYGGTDYPSQDITVAFTVDPAVVDRFNTANGTDYALLPEQSYQLSNQEGTIKAGTLHTAPQKVSFITTGEHAMMPLKEYILPISIHSSDVKINEAISTTIFLVKAQPNLADYPAYDKSTWNIQDFSSEEAQGEGPDNGRAIFVLDGNPDTFWHSQWQGASPGPPHYLTVDMGEVKTLHGIITKARMGGDAGKPNEVTIETSMDNVLWEAAGSLNLMDNANEQKNFLTEFKQARYFKLIINSSHNASHAHLAELGTF